MKYDSSTGSRSQQPEEPECSADKPPSCCAPRNDRAAPPPVVVLESVVNQYAASADASRPTVSLPADSFLMGTNYAHGFPADGEGPVRRVSLSAFDIDAYPVTNADFAAFVAATGYRTEAEVYGWSFVFWSHVPADRFEAMVEDTVEQAPWWC